MSILEKIQFLIRNNLFRIIGFIMTISIGIFVSNLLSDLFRSNPLPTIFQNQGKKANYSRDIDFLECIGIQYDCIYDNIRSGNEKFIIENCKDENFCNLESTIRVRGKRK